MIIARFFRFSILMLLILLSWPSITHAQTILPYDKFLNLSDEQKTSYIEMIRNLALDLSQNPNLVDVVQTPGRRLFLDQLFEQALTYSQAASKNSSDTLCAQTNFKNVSNDDLFGDMSLTLNCREIQSDRSEPLYYKPGVEGRIEGLYAELMARIQSGKITPRSKYYKEGIGGFRAVIAEIKQYGTSSKKVSSSWMSQEYSNLGRMGSVLLHIKPNKLLQLNPKNQRVQNQLQDQRHDRRQKNLLHDQDPMTLQEKQKNHQENQNRKN